jgi:hypothetical protein
MRKQHIVLSFCFAVALLLGTAPSAHAAKVPVFFSWGGEQIVKVAEFPDTEDFQVADGTYIDAGYRYKHVSLFFVPVWNYGGEWCGYVGDSNRYLRLNKDELDVMAKAASVTLPEVPSLPFWDAYGGKLVILLIFGVIVASGRVKK